jgi:hypothetical protein
LNWIINSYVTGPNQSKKRSIEAKLAEPAVKPTFEEKMNEAVRDVKVGYLSKEAEQQTDTSFRELWGKLVLEYPNYLPLYMAKLKYLDGHPTRQEHLSDIIGAAQDIINRISKDELATCLGQKVDLDNGDSVKVDILVFANAGATMTTLLTFPFFRQTRRKW